MKSLLVLAALFAASAITNLALVIGAYTEGRLAAFPWSELVLPLAVLGLVFLFVREALAAPRDGGAE